MSIALVQHAISPDGSSTTGTSVSLAFSGAVTSGNAVVGTVTYSQGAGGVDLLTSVKDDKNNTYSVVAKLFDSGATQYVALFHLENITNAPTTLTASFSGTLGFLAIAEAEFSGVATTSAIDGSTSQVFAGGTGTDAVTSGNITTTANGDLIYSAFYDEAVAGATFTHGTGFTTLDINPSGGTFPFGHEYMIQSSAGTVAGTWTQSISGSTDVLVLALKAAAGAGDTLFVGGGIHFI